MSTIFVEPIQLTGQHVTLEPLCIEHDAALQEAVCDGSLWKLWYTAIPTPEKMHAEIERRLALQKTGSMMPFVVRRLDTGQVCGMTTYMNIDAAHRRLEIGSTWYAASAQRTAVNTETKWLLLTHAFEVLDCMAVEFRTHWMNHASRQALARLGAKQDGVLRHHMRMADGSIRDTVVFSIIAPEWTTVKRHLSDRLER